MAFIAAPNVVKVELRYVCLDQQVENVIHFRKVDASEITLADMDQIGQAVVEWHETSVQPGQHPGCWLMSLHMSDLTTDSGIVVDYTAGLPHQGEYATGAALPNNVTVAVKLATPYRGRSYQGRQYVIGMSEELINGNTIVPTTYTSYTNAYSALIGILLPDWALVVVSYQVNKTPRTVAHSTAVTSVKVNQTIDSQRRRLPERGK